MGHSEIHAMIARVTVEEDRLFCLQKHQHCFSLSIRLGIRELGRGALWDVF